MLKLEHIAWDLPDGAGIIKALICPCRTGG